MNLLPDAAPPAIPLVSSDVAEERGFALQVPAGLGPGDAHVPHRGFGPGVGVALDTGFSGLRQGSQERSGWAAPLPRTLSPPEP